MPIERPEPAQYDAVILAVGHKEFRDMGTQQIHAFGKQAHVLYDVKSILGNTETDGRL